MTSVVRGLRLSLGLACLILVAREAGAQGTGAAPAAVPGSQETAVLSHLDSALGWYHQMQAMNGWSLQPGDEFYRGNQRDFTREVLTSAFTYARAMGASIAVEGAPGSSAAAGGLRERRLAVLEATTAERLRKLRDDEAQLEARLASAPDGARPPLQARLGVIQAEIDFDSAVAQSLEKVSSLFAGANGEAGTGSLSGQIAELERSVPDLIDAGAGSPAKAQSVSGGVAARPASDGLINRATALFSLLRMRRSLDVLIAQAGDLERTANTLAEPLAKQLREQVLQENDWDGREGKAADSQATDPLREKIEQATAAFRGVSAALLPLRQEAIALERSRDNLTEWRASLASQTDTIVRTLFVRAIGLLALIGLLVVVSEIWRRATFKYVHDHRRRRQFLLIRRFLTGVLMAAVIITGMVSDFSSLATFAGFITAGIAVALQTIILSVAAYFFLIGRYGVRVGDRITVSGVTGDVIDIGLVRVFLMELAGTGVNLHPTGRIVVLANSSLFSATPVYKQLPGTAYAWHEVYVNLAGDEGTAHVEERLLAAVNAVYAGYRPSLENQSSAVERLLDVRMDVPVPASQVRLTDAGIEVVVAYPAEILRMAEIDARVTAEVLAVIRGDAALKKALAGTPRIRAAVKG